MQGQIDGFRGNAVQWDIPRVSVILKFSRVRKPWFWNIAVLSACDRKFKKSIAFILRLLDLLDNNLLIVAPIYLICNRPSDGGSYKIRMFDEANASVL